MDETEHQPKISLPEVLLIGMLFMLFDGIEIFLVFFGLDDFWIIDAITATIFFYLFMKGIPPMTQLIAWVIELFPWVGALPLLTIGWFLTVWADRHPASFFAQLGQAALKVKGGGAGVAKAPAVRGAGAQSLRRIERAEGAAQAKVERVRSAGTRNKTSSSDDALEEVRAPMEEVPGPQFE